jgi:hypothetical protein
LRGEFFSRKGGLRLRFRNLSGRLPLELVGWAGGLIFLAAVDPERAAPFGLCLLKKMGLPFCPGCGLGRSVSLLLHGDFIRSLQAHPLGLPAFLILSARIVTLSHKLLNRTRAPLPKTLI